MLRTLLLLLMLLLPACAAQPGQELPRRGDEIVICGRMFHTGAPVVLWTDPGGYDAYRTEKRFAPWEKAAFAPQPAASGIAPATPNRYGLRFAPRPQTGEPGVEPLTTDQLEQVRGGGWDLDLLRTHVDQFVLHYDVCGVSRQCFRTLHDVRGLSVHFMLDIDGTIYQTMDVKERAWHATVSNDRSVGVEIANIGAYAPGEKDPFTQWYSMELFNNRAGGETAGSSRRDRITIPAALGDGGVRTPGFIGYTLRPGIVFGDIQGRRLAQYDLTPQQYASLLRLTGTLHAALPNIALDYPRDASGTLITHALGEESLASFRGVLGHYHVQENKSDPGPALQWDLIINGARRTLGMPALPPGDPCGINWSAQFKALPDPVIVPPGAPAR